MCLYVLTASFWCALRVPNKNDAPFVFTSGCLSRVIYVICVCLYIVVLNTYCVVFLVCFYSSCVPYVVSFSGLSIFIAPSVFSNVYILLSEQRCHKERSNSKKKNNWISQRKINLHTYNLTYDDYNLKPFRINEPATFIIWAYCILHLF